MNDVTCCANTDSEGVGNTCVTVISCKVHAAYKIFTSMYMIYRMSREEKKPKEPTKTSEIVI